MANEVTTRIRFHAPLGLRVLFLVGMWTSFDGGPWCWRWNLRETGSVIRSIACGGM